jgi:hypothetical protein
MLQLRTSILCIPVAKKRRLCPAFSDVVPGTVLSHEELSRLVQQAPLIPVTCRPEVTSRGKGCVVRLHDN